MWMSGLATGTYLKAAAVQIGSTTAACPMMYPAKPNNAFRLRLSMKLHIHPVCEKTASFTHPGVLLDAQVWFNVIQITDDVSMRIAD